VLHCTLGRYLPAVVQYTQLYPKATNFMTYTSLKVHPLHVLWDCHLVNSVLTYVLSTAHSFLNGYFLTLSGFPFRFFSASKSLS